MNRNIKKIILFFCKIIALPTILIPAKIRKNILFSLLLIESRSPNPTGALKNLFLIKDKLDMLINERALAYEGRSHPKHRLMNYHDFFVRNIPDDSNVLDIGCGIGAVAKAVAEKVSGVQVTGIDNNKDYLGKAMSTNSNNNLEFIHGDALEIEKEKDWNVIILSNVLEHINSRVEFLLNLINKLQPDIVLIRVPLFERNWEIPMRKELGINYYSDNTHYIEHTVEQFNNEMDAANLKIDSVQYIWGEIWAKCTPIYE